MPAKSKGTAAAPRTNARTANAKRANDDDDQPPAAPAPKKGRTTQKAPPQPEENAVDDEHAVLSDPPVLNAKSKPTRAKNAKTTKNKAAQDNPESTLPAGTISIGTAVHTPNPPVDDVEMLPPAPEKKKKTSGGAKKSKGKEQAAIEAGETASDLPAAQGGPVATETEPTTRTRQERKTTKSNIAKQVSQQEEDKQRQKDQKLQRQLEKQQKTPIIETPEETEAFLANARQATSSKSTSKNSQPNLVRSAPPPNKQQEMNMIIAQQVAKRMVSPAPSAFSVATSGSRSASISAPLTGRGTHLAPPSVTSSRAASLQPNAKSHSRSTSVSAPPSVASRADSLHAPSTLTNSSLPDDDFGAANDPVLDSTLAECLKNLPHSLAPQLPPLVALPAPLREPRRKVPLEEIDYETLSPKEQKAYDKKTKLTMAALVDGDQTIVTAILSRLDALVNTHDPFPNGDDLFMLCAEANSWGCRKFGRANFELLPDSRYFNLLVARLANMRSGLVRHADHEVPTKYGLLSPTDPHAIQKNQKLVALLLHNANFTLPSLEPKDRGAFYENPLFGLILRQAFFYTAQGTGVKHRDLWRTVTVPALAAVATVVEKVLLEYKTGKQIRRKFSGEEFRVKYLSHIVTLCHMYNADPERLETYCSEMSQDLLSPYTAPDVEPVSIAPRIPVAIIAAEYGRSSGSSMARTQDTRRVLAGTGDKTRKRDKSSHTAPDNSSQDRGSATGSWVRSQALTQEAPDITDADAWEAAMAPPQSLGEQLRTLKSIIESDDSGSNEGDGMHEDPQRADEGVTEGDDGGNGNGSGERNEENEEGAEGEQEDGEDEKDQEDGEDGEVGEDENENTGRQSAGTRKQITRNANCSSDAEGSQSSVGEGHSGMRLRSKNGKAGHQPPAKTLTQRGNRRANDDDDEDDDGEDDDDDGNSGDGNDDDDNNNS